MNYYTILYIRGHDHGGHVTTIKANSEEEAINIFYANNPKCYVVYPVERWSTQ